MKILDNPTRIQAHCLVTQADTQPKPAKELALPTHGLIEIKHETLTRYIKHLAESANFKGCTFNKLRNGLIGNLFEMPNVSYTHPLGTIININTYRIDNKMRTLIIVLLLTSINSFGQNKKFKWSDETCDYESSYDINKYSEIQLRNCYTLTYNYFFRINHTPSVFKPEDIESLKLDSLDSEYIFKINLLKSLDLPRNDYWEDLKKSIMKELGQYYKLSRIAYQGYIEPKVLKNWFYQDSCLNRHVNALVTGGDSLLIDWKELTSILVKESCCPDKVWEEYDKQYDSNKKFDFAKVYVTTFGWWNCAIRHIDQVDDKLDDKTRHEEFRKLFISTKKNQCDEP